MHPTIGRVTITECSIFVLKIFRYMKREGEKEKRMSQSKNGDSDIHTHTNVKGIQYILSVTNAQQIIARPV